MARSLARVNGDDANGTIIKAACKGGAIGLVIPDASPGWTSSLCEIVGRLMSKPATGRQVAVMLRTQVTLRLARKLVPRRVAAGIRIALVGPRGEVEDVKA
jgi:hypothetical protein